MQLIVTTNRGISIIQIVTPVNNFSAGSGIKESAADCIVFSNGVNKLQSPS